MSGSAARRSQLRHVRLPRFRDHPPKRRAKIVALVSQTCRRLLRGGPMILRETESEYLGMSAEPA
jgi:hypothetical protein